MNQDIPYSTHSVCEHCFKHIEGLVYESDGKILMDKFCPDHGKSTVVIFNHSEIYHKLNYNKNGLRHPRNNSIMFDVTNRCNLKCPDCYQMPDNKTVDKPPFMVMDEIKNAGSDIFEVVLVGAEPTMRKDLHELIKEIYETNSHSGVTIASNGIKFNDKGYTDQLAKHGLGTVIFGLNHWSYQGSTVHEKQLKGIQNISDAGIKLHISYTLETYDHLKDVLTEMLDLWNKVKIVIFRLRMGSNIGRTSATNLMTLSDHFYKFTKACDELNLPWHIEDEDNNIYHIMINVNGMPIRLIQWPDVTNINLQELKTGPWCNFYEGPITNFVHQIIMRDISVNKKINLPDVVPYEYTRKHWVENQ